MAFYQSNFSKGVDRAMARRLGPTDAHYGRSPTWTHGYAHYGRSPTWTHGYPDAHYGRSPTWTHGCTLWQIADLDPRIPGCTLWQIADLDPRIPDAHYGGSPTWTHGSGCTLWQIADLDPRMHIMADHKSANERRHRTYDISVRYIDNVMLSELTSHFAAYAFPNTSTQLLLDTIQITIH